MSTMGWIHTIFASIALLMGTIVVFTRKGTRWHRTLGHFYLTSMVALNASAFFMYNLSGRFSPFHWMAVASLVTLLAGMIPVFTQRPKGSWLELHGGIISGSYVGLLAAAAAEVTSRIPADGDDFSTTAAVITAVTIIVVVGVGVYLIRLYLPGAMGRTPSRFRRV